MTWFIDVIQVAPLAVITAPEKRCGKSQLLFFLARLVRRPLSASNITPAAMFRSIEAWSPTLLIDEADTFLRENEELKGVINCGHTKDSAYVIRTIGNDHTPYRFNVWGAKAIAGIGHLSDTIMDRSITMELRRKLPHEKVERLRYIEGLIFTDIQAKLARFAIDYAEIVKKSRPQLPEQLNDRAQDNWESLLAIASVVGHEWPRRAIKAAIKLSISETTPISISTELLLSIKEIIEAKKIDKISSVDLIQELCVDDEQPWAAYNRGRPITPKQVASFLKKYGIKSKGIRIGHSTPKGFEKSQFNEAFSRYLTHSTESLENSRNTQQFNEYKNYNVAENNTVAATPPSSATLGLNDNNDCCLVADRLRDEGDLMEMVI
ncbi:DUF3631 domain-containing protein [Legionella feeleii]|uniref:Protein of uncharacterized function (DUF3631) n=1 Tax=Legionella feeleii TaxID=453 RepID=A0A0W0U4H8_9GAMM|nr:DUF3631 domain-containing protein [Legionella feeleii]KTD02657.1 hypothetical protein Lfee_0812 [Legionella feeleii]SPX61213.1 Protein of uncharacterised function (DUF3631) [Legionella feeleii]